MEYAGRKRSLAYASNQQATFKISRSKIELFMQCPRCFWLDAKFKISRPSSPPFNINKAIDELFKKEFDYYREQGKPHPIMKDNQIKAVPFSHDDLNKWRHNFTGIGVLHEPTNLYVYGAIDDVWVNQQNELIIVDYKATAKSSEVSIESDWQISYKRQIEIYQWLFSQNGFKVSPIGYFVYTNARFDLDNFNNTLQFVTKLIPYQGKTDWIEGVLYSIKDCLDSDDMPPVGEAAMGGACEFCTYAKNRTELSLKALGININ